MKRLSGFTMIEMMLTISFIFVLILLGIPKLSEAEAREKCIGVSKTFTNYIQQKNSYFSVYKKPGKFSDLDMALPSDDFFTFTFSLDSNNLNNRNEFMHNCDPNSTVNSEIEPTRQEGTVALAIMAQTEGCIKETLYAVVTRDIRKDCKKGHGVFLTWRNNGIIKGEIAKQSNCLRYMSPF